MATDALSVSIIVPVYRGGNALNECLHALLALDPRPLEIIVVADGKDSKDLENAAMPGIRCLPIDGPSGPAHARNHGARDAVGDIALFVDADVRLQPDAVGRVAAAFAADDIVAVFGSYDDSPAAPEAFSQFKNLSHHFVHQAADPEASTFWAGCGAIRRTVFLDIGGFHTGYRRPCIEDIELGYRLVAAGLRIRIDKQLQGTHLKRWTLRSAIRADLLDRAVPWTELIHATRHMPNGLNVDTRGRISVALSGLLVVGLVVAPWIGTAALVAIVVLVALIAVLHVPFLAWARRKRGLRFAVACLLWHILYLWTAGLGYLLGTVRHLMRRRAPTPVGDATGGAR